MNNTNDFKYKLKTIFNFICSILDNVFIGFTLLYLCFSIFHLNESHCNHTYEEKFEDIKLDLKPKGMQVTNDEF